LGRGNAAGQKDGSDRFKTDLRHDYALPRRGSDRTLKVNSAATTIRIMALTHLQLRDTRIILVGSDTLGAA
jgi:hypothetical protein